MEYERESGSSNPLRTHPEATFNEGDPHTRGKKSGSSSSSDSSLESNITEEDVQSNSLPKSEQIGHGFPGHIPSPEVSAHTPDWSMQSGSATQSPPIQMMGRPGGYDPNRIPSSVFAGKPAAPMEWSVASNESLFSIHMGNNSFSRDQAILLGRSGELTKFDELINFPTSLPPVTEATVDANTRSSNMGEDFGATQMANETAKVVLRETAEDYNKEQMPPAEGVRNSASSYHSYESGTSNRSFAFPVLAGEGERNSSVKVAGEGERNNSVKVDSEKQLSQPLTSGATPDAAPNAVETKWFRCLSCCPLCF